MMEHLILIQTTQVLILKTVLGISCIDTLVIKVQLSASHDGLRSAVTGSLSSLRQWILIRVAYF